MAGPGRPGRLAANAAGFPEPGSGPVSRGFSGRLRARLRPPADLSPEAKAVFIDVVVNSNPEHVSIEVDDFVYIGATCSFKSQL